jgi:hypothetical protein
MSYDTIFMKSLFHAEINQLKPIENLKIFLQLKNFTISGGKVD